MELQQNKANNLKIVKSILRELKIRFWLCNDTLLECALNKPLDGIHNISISIWYDDWNGKILVNLLKEGFTLINEKGITYGELYYELEKDGIGLDIYFCQAVNNVVYQPIFSGNEILHLEYPKFSLEQCNYQDSIYFVPDLTRTVLTRQYGEDWREPEFVKVRITKSRNIV